MSKSTASDIGDWVIQHGPPGTLTREEYYAKVADKPSLNWPVDHYAGRVQHSEPKR